jgi:hypothetical protein
MPRFDIDEESCPSYAATDLFERMEEADWEGDYAEMRAVRWELQRLGWIVDRQPTREEAEAERRPDDPRSWRLLRLWEFVDVRSFPEAHVRKLFAHPYFPTPAAIDAIGPMWYSFEVDLFLRILGRDR